MTPIYVFILNTENFNPASFSSLLGSRVAHGPLKADALASDRSMPLWPSERLKLELVRTKHYNITIYKPIRPQTSAIPSRACYSGWAAAVAVAVVPRTTTTSSKTSIIAKALPLPPVLPWQRAPTAPAWWSASMHPGVIFVQQGP